jgi:DinB family protein
MSVFTNPASASKENARAYTAAVVDLVGDRDPFDVLRKTAGALDKSIQGLTGRQLAKRETPGKWSIRHVLRHLADSEVVWGWRLRMILAQERPAISGYDQDLWADRLGYGDADPRESVAEFATLRKGNLRLIKRATPQDLERVGVHSERGEESVRHMLRLYAGHDLLHLRQIARIKTVVGAR